MEYNFSKKNSLHHESGGSGVEIFAYKQNRAFGPEAGKYFVYEELFYKAYRFWGIVSSIGAVWRLDSSVYVPLRMPWDRPIKHFFFRQIRCIFLWRYPLRITLRKRHNLDQTLNTSTLLHLKIVPQSYIFQPGITLELRIKLYSTDAKSPDNKIPLSWYSISAVNDLDFGALEELFVVVDVRVEEGC